MYDKNRIIWNFCFHFAGAKEGPKFCFNLNNKGVEGANCGRDGNNFYPCSPQYVAFKIKSVQHGLMLGMLLNSYHISD